MTVPQREASGTIMSADFSETVNISFHNIQYSLSISLINGDTLSIEAEQLSDASCWRGDFTSSHVEDMTTKTGNFKKFPVFVKMLLSAVKQASDSVFVDLLTYQDLEVLKSRKAAAGAQPAHQRPSHSMPQNNKRYLILTYAAEFDRVHYPLPLLYNESPDPNHLRNIIAQLRSQLDALKRDGGGHSRGGLSDTSASNAGEMRRLREENQALRQQLKQLDRAVRADLPDSERMSLEARELAKELKLVRKERDLLHARVENADAEMERERGLHRRELRRKAKELQDVQEQLAEAKEHIRELKLQIKALLEELAALDGRKKASGSVDRARATYQKQQPGSGSRPNSGGRSSSNYYGYQPQPRASSRSNTRETSSRERNGGSGGGSRPNSAPASNRGRFDPTEYVKQRRDREREASASRGRSPPPPRSANTSARSSPHSSRPSSAERAPRPAPSSSRPNSAERLHRGLPAGSAAAQQLYPLYSRGTGGSRPTSRPSSSERDRAGRGAGTSGGAAAAGSRGRSPSGRHDDSSGGESPYARRGGNVKNAWGEAEGWSKFPPLNTGGSGAAGPSSSLDRATSPGRALQEVKRKLSEYVQGRSSAASDASISGYSSSLPQAGGSGGGKGGSAAAPAPAASSSTAGLFNDASADIADIDSRLHALQNFLRMAKSGMGGHG